MSRFEFDWIEKFEGTGKNKAASQAIREQKARIPDGGDGKRVPYSLRTLLKSIRAFWTKRPSETDGKYLITDVPEFIRAHESLLDSLRKKYDFKTTTVAAAKKKANYIEEGNPPSYLVMRFFADCVGIPTSLLLSYSHFIGDVAASDKAGDDERLIKAKALLSIQRTRNALNVLAQEIELTGEERFAERFIKYKKVGSDPKAAYSINVEGLHILSEVYNAK